MTVDLRYPVGKAEHVPPTDEIRRRAIDEIAALPALVHTAVSGTCRALGMSLVVEPDPDRRMSTTTSRTSNPDAPTAQRLLRFTSSL